MTYSPKPHNMKSILFCLFAALLYTSCKENTHAADTSDANQIQGTWKLVSNIIITKGDTTIAYPVKGKEEVMLKIYNDSHFSFFTHDTKQGKTKDSVFTAGAGTYKLTGNDYSERLEFCNLREWENHDFNFKLKIQNDTLVQRGVERIDSLNVNREIIETYVRLKAAK